MNAPDTKSAPSTNGRRVLIEPTWLWLWLWFIGLSLGSVAILGSAFVYARFVAHLPSQFNGYYVPLHGDETTFWKFAILPCAPPTFGIARTVIKGQKPYAKRVSAALIGMFYALFFGSGMVITLSAAMAALNGALDRSTPQTLTFVITNKRHIIGRGSNYYLQVHDSRPPSDLVELPVQEHAWDRANIGDTLRVTLRSGAFGLEWIERIEGPMPAETPSRAR